MMAVLRPIFSLITILFCGAILGLSLTYIAIAQNPQFGRVEIGSWVAWPDSGGERINPYMLASQTRRGGLPLGSGDGVAFIAAHDRNGKALNGRCLTKISGHVTRARYWTLSVYDRKGRVIGNPAQRYSFSSPELYYDADGNFEISIAPYLQAGHWLPTANIQDIEVVLRLYDTPIVFNQRGKARLELPEIIQEHCF